MKGTLWRLKLPSQTDDEARVFYERWAHQTGRDRLIDWTTFKVEQRPDATYAGARAK